MGFESRYIVRDDFLFRWLPLGGGRYFNFEGRQKSDNRSWHSRPYEYHFVLENMSVAIQNELIGQERILDLACGADHPGYMATADTMRGVPEVVAFDMDSKLLTNGMDHPRVKKVVGYAVATGLRLESFDAIYCVSALEHMLEYRGAIAEIHRLLKPGGMAFVTLDISTDTEKTKRHNVDGKTPDDYRDVFEKVGLHVFGDYNSDLPDDAVDAVCSKYPLADDISKLGPGQHNALKAFRMILRKGI